MLLPAGCMAGSGVGRSGSGGAAGGEALVVGTEEGTGELGGAAGLAAESASTAASSCFRSLTFAQKLVNVAGRSRFSLIWLSALNTTALHKEEDLC